MPEVDEKVMKFVEDILRKNPGIELEDLFERTKKFKSSIARLSRRQFNARYPLQVKRRRALAAKAQGAGKKKGTSTRGPAARKSAVRRGAPPDRVRQILLQFATDITAAEERKDLVKVLAAVDLYVDQVMKEVSRG
ncbi:MAG: CooT family nickel-binding protein [Gemmatimonadota bacterium]